MSRIGNTTKDITTVIKNAVVTEKSAMVAGMELSVYTFEVEAKATKPSVMAAIKSKYKVTPVKVNIINVPSKRVLIRGKRGVKPGFKKAMVYLKSGDKIEIV